MAKVAAGHFTPEQVHFFGQTLEAMLEGEMNQHPGYEKHSRQELPEDELLKDAGSVAIWNRRKVKLCFSRPGKPTDNAYIESFSGKFRNECVSTHWFENMAEAQTTMRNGGRSTIPKDRIAPSGRRRRLSSRPRADPRDGKHKFVTQQPVQKKGAGQAESG